VPHNDILFKSFSEFHNSVHRVITSLSKGSDGLSTSAFSVFNDHLNVVRGQAFFIKVSFFSLWYLFSGRRGLNFNFLTSFGDNGVFELIDFILSSLESIHIRLSENDIRVFISRSFPDIRIINADNEGFSFLDSNSVDSSDGLKTHLGHGLLELLFSSVRFTVEGLVIMVVSLMVMSFMLMLMVMIAVLSVKVFSLLSGYLNFCFLSHYF
jgi:hypothetical protein